MPKKSPVPKYSKHPNGQAYVYHRSIENPGHVLYLGPHGSEVSIRRYQAFLKRIEANTQEDSQKQSVHLPIFSDDTIADLCAVYLQHCKSYYRDRDGKQTKEFSCTAEAIRPLCELFADEPARAFRPSDFETYRNHLISKRHARTTINSHAGRIRRMFRWAARKEMLPASIWQSLSAVEGLKAGRTEAAEPPPVPAITWDDVAPVLPYLSPTVAAMVEVQYWCGMRPQDVCRLRPCDIDRSRDIWIYTPPKHKNAWRGHTLVKAIPQRVQHLLLERFRGDEDYLFSPQDAVAWLSAERERNAGKDRKTKVYPCEQRARARRKAITQAKPRPQRDHYDTHSYRQAIEYGLKKMNRARKEAGLASLHWTPMQLRHGIATFLDGTLGRQAAQKYLGHKHLSTTGIYVAQDVKDVIAVAQTIDGLE